MNVLLSVLYAKQLTQKARERYIKKIAPYFADIKAAYTTQTENAMRDADGRVRTTDVKHMSKHRYFLIHFR